jgi:hypothetical protein
MAGGSRRTLSASLQNPTIIEVKMRVEAGRSCRIGARPDPGGVVYLGAALDGRGRRSAWLRQTQEERRAR